MMHKHPKPIGQRKVSPPGPSYMNNDQMGKLPFIHRVFESGLAQCLLPLAPGQHSTISNQLKLTPTRYPQQIT